MFEYIKHRQRLLEKKWEEEEKRIAEEAEREEARIAQAQAQARRKKLLIELQEDNRIRQKRIEVQEQQAEEKWDKHFDNLLSDIKDQFQKNNNNKIDEIKVIIKTRQPSLQELDWENWLTDPLNQRLAVLDFEHAIELFKRDNLLARRRRPTRGKAKSLINYALTFTGDTAADARFDYVSTTFNPDSYDGAGTGLNRGFTVSYWVKPLEVVGSTFFAFGKRSQTNGRFQFGIKNQNKIDIGIGSAEKDDNNVNHGMEVGTWYHFAVTYGGDNDVGGDRQVHVYLNGTELLKTGASGGGMGTANWDSGKQNCDEGCDDAANAASYLYFGGRSAYQDLDNPYNQGWACSLSEVAIYNVEKDEDGTFANEVYNGGTGYDHSGNSGLVGYWKFNEGSGTTVKDYGPYAKHGTLTSDAENGSGVPTWGTAPTGYGQ